MKANHTGQGLDRYQERSEGGSTQDRVGTGVHRTGLGRCKQNGMEADVQDGQGGADVHMMEHR